MFEIGNYVIYRSEGVCVISDIRSESFGMIGKDEKYYILTPVNDERSTVFVPLANEKLVGFMRRLLTAKEITAMLSELRDQRMEWETDSRARNNAFKDVLLRGDRRELTVLVNTVSEKLEQITASGRKAGAADLNALHKAKKMLYEEFSATTDIDSADKIIPLLKGEIALSAKETKR